jgi:hypothetical protein
MNTGAAIVFSCFLLGIAIAALISLYRVVINKL